MTKERIGAKIKSEREKLGWSHDRLAEAAGVVTRTLQDIEYGATKEPGFDRILSILTVLAEESGTPLIEYLEPYKPGKTRKSVKKDPVQKEISQHHFDPDWQELARIFYALKHAEPVTRLSALLLLTGDKEYSRQLRAIPGGAPFAAVLEKLPRRS